VTGPEAGFRPGPRDVRRATTATFVAFAGAGMAIASWMSRIPQIRDRLHLEPSELGLVLLSVAAGSVLALPMSGPVIARFGARRTVIVTATVVGLALVCLGLGYLVGVVPVVLSLFGFGFFGGAWDVAMNVHGANAEQHLGYSVMSRFHAVFSLGTVAGALIGAAMVALGVPVAVHLPVVGLVVGVPVVFTARWFIPDHAGPSAAEQAVTGRRGAFASWREPRTLLIGVFVLAFAFAEGVGNDWIAVAVIDGHRTPQAIGTLAFAVFLTAMTTGRWIGPALLDRFGRVPVVRSIALLGIVGVLVFVFAPVTAVAFAGAVLWGLGASLGFPVGMSAGADDPTLAAGRVSVISSIGYCAFLAGPPLVGFLGDHVGVVHAVVVPAVLLTLAAVISPIVRPLDGSAAGRSPARTTDAAGAPHA
jgi:MFS family permease